MRIAIIGWGSLIWNPGDLEIDGGWRDDGPFLPIEFARISRRNRLTLVIHSGAALQQTYWTMGTYKNLDMARENLQKREGTIPDFIHSLTKKGNASGNILPEIKDSIAEWLRHHDVDAAVWTGLPSNFQEKRGCPFSVDEAMRYLHELVGKGIHHEAETYIRMAPRRIRTAVRARAEQELGWLPLETA